MPFTTKEELRASQAADPPFGAHLCAPREALVRMHVTSGTTGEPVAIGLTARDHAANSRIGGEAFAIAGVRADHVIAHCLNYALYAGGIADHMALEASGATVVPVGVGQSARLLELIAPARHHALFGTLSYPVAPGGSCPRGGARPARARAAPHRHGRRARRRPGARCAREIEAMWGAPTVRDTFGMSDVWSTMAGECDARDGLHLTTGGHAVLEVIDPESGAPVVETDAATGMPAADAQGELVWTHLRREASPLLRYRSADLGRVWTGPCACGRTTPRIRIDGRRDDMLRVQAVNVYPQAIGALLEAGRLRPLARGRRRRPDRPAVARLRRGRRRRWRRRVERCRPRCARRSTLTRVPAGDAAGRRAQDAHRLPYRARRGAPPAPPRQRPAEVRHDRHDHGTRPRPPVVWDRQARRNAWTRETIEGIADAIEAAGADEPCAA